MNQGLPTLDEMTDILDIKGIQVWDLTTLWFALGGVLFLIFLLGFWRWWRHRRARRLGREEALSPLEKALNRLNELTERGLIEGGRIRLFYFNLSEIFRDFLEEEMNINALEATLEELKPLLKKCPDFTQEELAKTYWFLEISDMAKFARYIPPREDIINSVKTCRVLIEAIARRRAVPSESSEDVSISA